MPKPRSVWPRGPSAAGPAGALTPGSRLHIPKGCALPLPNQSPDGAGTPAQGRGRTTPRVQRPGTSARREGEGLALATETVKRPEELTPGVGGGDHCVIIFNNDTNSFDEVIYILCVATGCPLEEAEMETTEAHLHGRAYVHFADRAECERAATIIRSIGVRAVVEPF